MEHFLEYSSYEDVKSFSPDFVTRWEEFQYIKQQIDESLNEIENQIYRFQDIGINNFIDVDKDIKNVELKVYVVDKYNTYLSYINSNFISIPDYDSNYSNIEEVKWFFKNIYDFFYSENFEFIYQILTSIDFENLYNKNIDVLIQDELLKNSVCEKCDEIVLALKRALVNTNSKTLKDKLLDEISRFNFLKQIFLSTPQIDMVKYIYNLYTGYVNK